MKIQDIIKNYSSDILVQIWYSETTSEDNIFRIYLSSLRENDELMSLDVNSWEVGHGNTETGKNCLCLRFFVF